MKFTFTLMNLPGSSWFFQRRTKWSAWRYPWMALVRPRAMSKSPTAGISIASDGESVNARADQKRRHDIAVHHADDAVETPGGDSVNIATRAMALDGFFAPSEPKSATLPAPIKIMKLNSWRANS